MCIWRGRATFCSCHAAPIGWPVGTPAFTQARQWVTEVGTKHTSFFWTSSRTSLRSIKPVTSPVSSMTSGASTWSAFQARRVKSSSQRIVRKCPFHCYLKVPLSLGLRNKQRIWSKKLPVNTFVFWIEKEHRIWSKVSLGQLG